jgi:two-component system cell cycle sensor histidine kinase/response regulator CckA
MRTTSPVSSRRSAGRWAGRTVAAIGAVGLAGWIFDVPVLKSVFPGLSTMKANTAAALVLAGVSLALLARSGIDELLFTDTLSGVPPASPGRMGINTAVTFVLLGLALLCVDAPPRWSGLPAQLLALAGGAVGLTGLVGYLYTVTPFYGTRSYTQMAVHTAVAFALLAAGILLARADRGIMAALTTDGAGGRMGRRFLPAAIGVPLALGWFILRGERAGFYDAEFGLSLLVIATMVAFGVLTWASAVSLNRADALVRESEARKTATLEAALDCIITIDHRGHITEFNAAAERVFGYRRADVMGREMGTLIIPSALRERHREGLARYLATGEGPVLGRRLEMPGMRADGTEFPIELTITRLPSDGPPMFTGFVRDITERRLLEDELRQAQKMEAVGRLAGGIAHDFNNLLTIIAGRARFALERIAAGASAQRDLDTIIGASSRAETLTRQLLAFGRKQMLQVQVLDLSEVVERMSTLLERTIPEDIVVATIAARDVGRVTADPTQIDQVIMNLVVNARDAMPRGGRLTIEVSNADLDDTSARIHPEVKPGAYVMLAVSDTGIGMDRETQAQIFEPFFTTKEPGKGTGLGLSTVYGIIKQSNGHVVVYSEPGRGTTFRIYLPRVGDATALASPEPPRSTRGDSETILVVDDDEEVRDLAREILASEGYTVLVAEHPDQALLSSDRHPGTMHLVLTDVVMPTMSGPQLIERLKVSRPDLRVLYMSGFADGAMLQHGVLEAGRAFLPKPFTRQSLMGKVREALAASRA